MPRHILHDFNNAYAGIREFGRKIEENHLVSYANQLTLSLILAFFPFVIFLFTLLGFLQLDPTSLLEQLAQILPLSVYRQVSGIIEDVLGRQHGQLLSISIIVAIHAASRGFRALTKGSNQVLGLVDRRNFIINYLISVAGVIVFALTIIIVLVAMVFGQQIIDLLMLRFPQLPLYPLIQFSRHVLPVLLIFIILTLFYMFVPARRVRFTAAFPGAIFTTVAWTGLTLLFQYYVDNFADYSLFYGALGTMVALLLWVQLISTIILLGVEINALLMRRGELTKHRPDLPGTN